MDEKGKNADQGSSVLEQSTSPAPLDAKPMEEIVENGPEDGVSAGNIPKEDGADNFPASEGHTFPDEIPAEGPAEAAHDPLARPGDTPSGTEQSKCECAGVDLLPELQQIKTAVAEISATAQRSTAEIREIHKLYHNEFASRLKSMQDELDQYHNADRGRTFDGILSAIARIYTNNETLIDEVADPKTRKHIHYLLLDLLDLLEEYGVLKIKSCVGDKRNTRHCQIVERIPTDDPALHDTIAASHNTGFYKDNRTIIKELVDVYFHDKTIPSREGSADDLSTEESNN